VTIVRFAYQDTRRAWRLEETLFGDFNLLVGISGVGKTSIINALRNVRAAGLSKRAGKKLEAEWAIELTSEGKSYYWEARTTMSGASVKGDDRDAMESGTSRFIHERITIDDETVLVDRSPEQFLFAGQKLPKLKDTESAIALLEAEESVAPLQRALQRILFSDTFGELVALMLVDRRSLAEAEKETASSLDALRNDIEMPILVKAYIAYKSHKESFERIRDQYMAIFPNVTDICIQLAPTEVTYEYSRDDELVTIAMKEEGVDRWIMHPYISSGMLRTFFHLAELELAPPGTVIVIDEYENSMGVNCLPLVTDHLKRRQGDLQFILTSHHPYVINNIPMEWWRVVTRHGGSVRVRDAREIPALNTQSRQDAFTLLINSAEYEEAIQ
jgi:hypothetical protein